jgi:hypothetical protein
MSTKEWPELAVGEEVVNAFEGVEGGCTDDVADGLEGGRCDGTRVWHNGERMVLFISRRRRARSRRRRCWISSTLFLRDILGKLVNPVDDAFPLLCLDPEA